VMGSNSGARALGVEVAVVMAGWPSSGTFDWFGGMVVPG